MKVYHIAPHYRRAELWEGNKNGQRVGMHTCTPRTDLSDRQRYEAICEWLARNGVFTTPEFQQPKRSAPIYY
jgi:hypothetical protein